MTEKDIIIMSQKELKKLHVVRKLFDKRLKQAQAAGLLGLSIRQVRRIIKRIREEGDKGIAHRSRGKPSNRALSNALRSKVIKLYRDKYWDFGPTLANEKLFEIDKIKIGDQTLRNWLMEDKAWEVSYKHRKHRKWRERKHHFGEMLQGDGSHHDWFEGRGPACVLMGYIDDATGAVFARFYGYEGTMPAIDSFKKYIRNYGIPHSLYMDNHSTYKSQAKPSIEDELAGRNPLSQFERGVKELDIKFIHARSPQAKGRIERLFKTFQDRLVKEMRLAGVRSIEEGNRFLRGYLPKYNKRFSVDPLERGDMHRPLLPEMDIDSHLCVKTDRVLRNDFTVAHRKKLYQIISKTRAKKVTVEERVTGRIIISYKGESLGYKEISQNSGRKQVLKKELRGIKKKYIPPMEHPWKKPLYDKSYPQLNSYQQKEKSSKKEKELLLVH